MQAFSPQGDAFMQAEWVRLDEAVPKLHEQD